MTQVEYLLKHFGEHDRTVRDWRYAATIWERVGPFLLVPFTHFSQLLWLRWVKKESQVVVWNTIAEQTGRPPLEAEIYAIADNLEVLAKEKSIRKAPSKKVGSDAALAAVIINIKAVVEEIRNVALSKGSDPDWNRMAQIAQKLEESISPAAMVKASLESGVKTVTASASP
jgi:hypothetical protein